MAGEAVSFGLVVFQRLKVPFDGWNDGFLSFLVGQ